MGRLTDEFGVITLFEPIDLAAGADSDSFDFSKYNECDIVLATGVLTVPGALSVFSGATVGAKTTALPFTYRLGTGDFKATGADLFGADIAEADGVLTLSATVNDHRTHVIHIDATDLADDHRWVTLALAAGTAQAVCGIAILQGSRYQPPATAI